MLRWMLLCVLVGAMGGCVPSGRIEFGPDDDDVTPAVDDDDTVPTDDDDTVSTDDDDTVPTDDDDTVPTDDDDAVPDDDDDDIDLSNYNGLSFTVEFDIGPSALDANGSRIADTDLAVTVHYWTDLQSGQLQCNQRVEVTGIAAQATDAGGPDCPGCTAHFILDPDTAVDVGDPASDPDDCAPGIRLPEEDWGLLMVTLPEDGGFGDLLDFLWLPADWMATSGWNVSALDGGQDYDELSQEAIELGLQFQGVVLLHAGAGTLSEVAGLDMVANPVSPQTAWYPFFRTFADPAEIPLTNFLEGPLWGASFWVINLGL